MAVPSPAVLHDRQSLRAALRARRRHIARSNGVPLTCPPGLRPLLDKAEAIALFIPLNDELDPWQLVDATDVTVVPVVDAVNKSMTFACWKPGLETQETSWGGQEPLEEAARAMPDVILVPLLGFDDEFNRIGQGGGYYDRYLAAHPNARRIGVAWEEQRVEPRIEAEAWDIPLDAILTERAFYIKDLNR